MSSSSSDEWFDAYDDGTNYESHADDNSDSDVEETTVKLKDSDDMASSIFESGTYIRVKSALMKKSEKAEKDFSRLKLIQEIFWGDKVGQSIYVTKFSYDGKYLAVGGKSPSLKVYLLLSEAAKALEKDTAEAAEMRSSMNSLKSDSAIFHKYPYKTFHGHTGDIFDISWSKNNFILSSSMDKTVRLWHVSKNEAICYFQHLDFVPCVSFHPKDDRFFLSGSLDSKLRLWSIPEKRVVSWNQTPNQQLITAVGFCKEGKVSIAGTYSGYLLFYETEPSSFQGLKYQSQIRVQTKMKNDVGKKITGIELFPASKSDEKILVTSNDSKIRLYNYDTKTLLCKYSGVMNNSSQIRASFNNASKFIICGSEDSRVYLYPIEPEKSKSFFKKANLAKSKTYESFEASSTVVTTAIFAPNKTIDLLEKAGFRSPILETITTPTSNTIIKSAWTCTEGALIVCGDQYGSLRIYENERIAKPSANSAARLSRTSSTNSFKTANISSRRNTKTGRNSLSLVLEKPMATDGDPLFHMGAFVASPNSHKCKSCTSATALLSLDLNSIESDSKIFLCASCLSLYALKK